MPSAGGISSQFGMVDETTFGTAPTVTRFLEFSGETIEQTKERYESAGMRVGLRTHRSSQWVTGRVQVVGDLEFQWQQQGMGLMLKHMMGTIASTQPNVGSNPTVYEHKATVGQIDGKSFACQVAMAGVDGVQRAFTYAGCKIAKWDISIDNTGMLTFKPTIDGVSESSAVGMAAATYATNTFPLTWTGGTITLPGGATGNVTKFNLTGDNGLKLDRFFMAGQALSGTKKEQLEANLRVYSGTVDLEFGDLSAYNLFVNGTVGSMTAFFQGQQITSPYNFAVEITMPAVRFDGKSPDVTGPDIVMMSMPFVCLDDGSATTPVQIVYRTTDVTP